MKKKIISAVMSVMMVFALIGTCAVMAAENGTLSVTADRQFINKGERVTYTVSLDNISDLRGMQLGLTYDADKASYVEGSFKEEAGDFADYSDIIYENGTIGFVLALAEGGSDYSGAVASFTLEASETAPVGAIGVSVGTLIAKDSADADIDLYVDIADAEIVSLNNAELVAVPDTDAVHSGEELTYTVSMSEITLKGMQFTVEYDASLLELISAESAGTYKLVLMPGEGSVGIVFYNKEDIAVSGDLVKLKFRLKDIEASEEGIVPLDITELKAVSSAGALDISYTFDCSPIAAQKENRVEINFDADKMIAGSGEIVSYIVSLSGIDGYRGLQTALKYDLSKLEFVNVEPLSLMELADASFNSAVEGSVRIACVFTESASTTGGELARINFRVKDGASGIVDMSVTGTKVSSDGAGYIDADYYASADEIYVYSGNWVKISAAPSKDIILPGEEVTYTFSTSDVTDFKGMQFKLNYDSSAMECVDIAKGSVLDSAVVKTITETSDGIIQGMINYSSGYTGSGELFSVTFRAKSVDSLMQPDVYFSSFTADDYITAETEPVDLYPTEPAAEVINAIEAIGEVTLDDKDAIEAARELYESLSEEIKERVTNYDKLVDAELKYDELYEALPVYECTVGENEVTVKQNKPCSEELTMYIAQHDAAGVLTKVDICEIGGDSVFEFTRMPETETVRCHIWNDNMQPYSDVEYN